MSDLESKLKALTEKAVVKMVSEGSFIQPDYANRVKVPADFMSDVWALVDVEKVKKQMAKRLEEELANRIVNHMAAELATDVKQILSVKERREALRAVVRENMERICGGELSST